MSVEKLSKGEQLFLDQMTRKKMVEWCSKDLEFEHLYGRNYKDEEFERFERNEESEGIYLEYAKQKKWISGDGTRILAAGWTTAARFLKR